MKKVFLCCLLIFIGFSCSKKLSPKKEERPLGKKKILSTVGMIEDLVKEIGGEKIFSDVLILGEIDPHSYEIVKGDDEKLGEADLIFYNGLGLEHGASLAFYLKNSSKAYALGDQILKNFPEKILRREEVIDPHIWMDLSLWAKLAFLIAEKLSELDPENRAFYLDKASLLQEKLLKQHEETYELLQTIPSERRYLVTSHDAFHYFARAYLLSGEKEEIRAQAPEGLAPDGAISPLDIKRILDFVKEKKITTIFAETNISRASLEKIVQDARKKGVELQLAKRPLYGDCMPEKEGYLSMQRHNTKVIFEALCQNKT